MEYKKRKRKSQELREKVKLLFNDPISHRNPQNTEVYLAKAPNRSKHPNTIDLEMNPHAHMRSHTLMLMIAYLTTSKWTNKNSHTYTYTHIHQE